MEFSLRTLGLKDAKSLVKHADNYKIARNLTNRFPHPYTIENAHDFISFANKDSHCIMGIDVGEIIGAIGIHPQSDVQLYNAELGYWLSEDYWGKGIISQAIPMMVKIGFERFEIDRIFARPFGSNDASKRVLEKSGFKLEAHLKSTFFKFGEYEDEFIYGIRRNES